MCMLHVRISARCVGAGSAWSFALALPQHLDGQVAHGSRHACPANCIVEVPYWHCGELHDVGDGLGEGIDCVGR